MKSKLLSFAVAGLLASAPFANGADDRFTLIVTGDAIVSLPLSSVDDPAFLEIADIVRDADVAIINLETVLRDDEGLAQSASGGGWLQTPGTMAEDLRWLGVDMAAHANNHSYDFGAEGIFSTHANLARVDIAIAGTGRDLPAARAPAYLDTGDARIALVSMASTFIGFGAASPAVPGHPGRPGLNPLHVTKRFSLSQESADRLREVAEAEQLPFFDNKSGDLSLGNFHLYINDSDEFRYVPDRSDWKGNLEQIGVAADNSDYAIVSIHAHQKNKQPGAPDFLVRLAHAAIDAGADVFFAHGTHYLLGIEIYRGRPIFYGLGNFFFQSGGVRYQPWEFHRDKGSDPEEYPWARGKDTYFENPAYWFGVLPVIAFEGATLKEIRLIPLDLQLGAADNAEGRPVPARGAVASQVGQLMQQLSQPLGTTIEQTADGELLVRVEDAPR